MTRGHTAKKDEFLSKIIHDLKTPTAAQIRALELFLDSCGDKIEAEERELIELTLNSCNYMKNLIETFSAVNKLEHEKIRLNYKKFYIAELIEEIVNELKILLKYHELNISVSSNKEVEINADRLQIKRVIINILSNAISHSFKNTTIEISAIETKQRLKVEIKNKGPFIKPPILNEIFEKFKTYPTSHSNTGTGLGLYLSKEIINAHYGNMIAKSTANDVSVFGFEIPVD